MTLPSINQLANSRAPGSDWATTSLERYAKETDAPLVRVAPRRTGPWTADNQLGYMIPIGAEGTYGTLVGDQPMGFKMDECEFPQVWTLALGISQQPRTDVEYNLIYDLVASVEFGCGGASQQLEFNVQNGAVISGPANAITVQVRRDGDFSTENLNQSFQLVYTVSRRPAFNPPVQRILASVAPAADRSGFLNIPSFGRFVSLMATNTPSVAQLFSATNFLTFTDGINVVGIVPGNQLVQSTKIPIPDHARFVYFQNTGLVDTSFKYFFDICF